MRRETSMQVRAHLLLLETGHPLYVSKITWVNLGENVRYPMHKYDIVNSDWSQNINIRHSKIESYNNRLLNIEHKCTGSVIRELCETRDSCNTQF